MRRLAAKLGLLRQAPVRHGGGQMQSVPRTVPAPIGGWNARDPLAAMAPTDAVMLKDWFPRVGDVTIRGGCADHKTGFAARPKTLAQHNGLGGTNKMFAVTDAGIFDSSTAGAVGAAVLARTAGYHSWVNMGVSGANYLCMFNGVDKPAFYDGAAWVAVDGASVPAITGVTTTNLIAANVYKRRLFMIEKTKLSFWYLPADAVGGAALEFQLGPLCVRGGYTMAMATWTRDGGLGPDDYAAFVTSEGEIVVFTGTNPADATAWSLVGVYFVGRPIGRKCFKKYGGELVLITQWGAFPLSKTVASQEPGKTALTNKIESAFIEAARTYGANVGWTCEIYPGQSAFVFNIPTTDGGVSAKQYVMNTTTKAWCEFSNWNASDFIVYNGELYFADATKVSKAWTGRSDYTLNITAEGQTAFNNFKSPRTKDWMLFRPYLRTSGSVSYATGLAIDFEVPPLLTASASSPASGTSVWDASRWDAGIWAGGLDIVADWITPGARAGVFASGRLKVVTNALEVQWEATEYIYAMGNVGT